jgi:FkbM family methyltransferase
MLLGAVADPDGLGMINAMMYNARVPEQYGYIFKKMPAGSVCIDCGANVGLISDLILKRGGVVFAFEPARESAELLQYKYRDNKQITVISKAVSDKNSVAVFHTGGNFDLGATLMNRTKKDSDYRVGVIRLVDFIQDLLSKQESIYLLKLDVEGVEFEILEDIIKSNVYKKIKYIVCETHEWINKELEPKLAHIKNLIQENKIENIYLDWV